MDFYPRPLRRGRHEQAAEYYQRFGISIHALFAEGDTPTDNPGRNTQISIHAFFAEGDPPSHAPGRDIRISIHALFAEGDNTIG